MGTRDGEGFQLLGAFEYYNYFCIFKYILFQIIFIIIAFIQRSFLHIRIQRRFTMPISPSDLAIVPGLCCPVLGTLGGHTSDHPHTVIKDISLQAIPSPPNSNRQPEYISEVFITYRISKHYHCCSTNTSLNPPTGASSGIGAETAVEFAKHGCRLALTGVTSHVQKSR